VISYGIVSSRSGVAILRTAIHLLLTYSTHFHWSAFRSSRPAIWHEILLVACPFMTLNQHFQSTAGNSEHCCNLLLLPLLHPFNGLFSMTTWVSRHQKGLADLDLNETRDDGVLRCSGISWTICKLETNRNSVSVTVFQPKPPKNMVSAWFRLRQKGTVELRFRPKLDHVETETSRNWISSEQTVVGSDLPGNNYLVQRDKFTRTDEAI